ncbi:uncharacterized protein PV09_06192 [Verruconis gallopava]|uniref:Kinesin-like protein n=1 Tax=Verruconis gallopava TaxID=253628 RepID=A0A0D2AT94_9PEZI|nr:uncharacterized protein PV09_06192 [Verruconis gallopava]KIW02369.1 hypothetical protein PV09_06192 [Verruconis gallopava]
MDVSDTQTMSSSRLRPPAKVVMPSIGLTEMSASEHNARSAMAPPSLPSGTHTLKHKPSGLLEPQSKVPRQTLAERAGQPYTSKNPPAQPSARHVNSDVKRTAQSGPKSLTSFSSTHGSSARGLPGPGFATNGRTSVNQRPQTAMGHSRSKSQYSARPGSAAGGLKRALSQSVRGDHPTAAAPASGPATSNTWSDETIERRLKGFDDMMMIMNKQMEGTTFNQQFLKDTIESQRDQLIEAQMTQKNMSKDIDRLREELSELKEENSGLIMVQTELQRNHEIEVDDLERKHRYELENLRDEHRKEIDRLQRETSRETDELRRNHREEIDELHRKHRQEIDDLERRYKHELEDERNRRLREVNEISIQRDEAISKIATGIGEKEREADAIREELRQRVADLEREKLVRTNLEAKFSDISANLLELQSANGAMRAKIDFLESDNQQQSNQFADLHRRMQEAIEAAAEAKAKLRAEETLRRKLHNQVQELKGNIRVFCRVRPTLNDDESPAEISFPDNTEEAKEIVVRGDEKTNALGKVTATNHTFTFDRVFGPSSANAEIFEEISQLVQSALDGYNVCIFCYGQTGSGKTHTMSSADGMIPRAVRQIYESATALEEKGWKYRMQGSFVEVYNENINDLLGRAEDLDKKKHEIQHDMKRCKTTITNVEVVELDSPDRVKEVLRTADKNRSVAATKANMRSSRSHSVFILTLTGENSITGEKCEGTLNLVDLAGSERLSHSKAEGDRLKETQNINKSLSCLGDVIGALGSKGESGHIPYRNSKLTYLLQFSLGGNSKTLMFVMVSPLQAHLSETLTSLKFATKVHNTHIGTAKRQSKVLH